MSEVLEKLTQAFREDHAVLGRGFYDLSTCLRANDLAGAKATADELDRSAGAHIAFEEEVLYPTLRRLLSDADADRFHGEHGMGLRAVQFLASLPDGQPVPEGQLRELLADSEVMERHIAECGEVFGALGRLPDSEGIQMLTRLEELRDWAPRWTEFAKAQPR